MVIFLLLLLFLFFYYFIIFIIPSQFQKPPRTLRGQSAQSVRWSVTGHSVFFSLLLSQKQIPPNSGIMASVKNAECENGVLSWSLLFFHHLHIRD